VFPVPPVPGLPQPAPPPPPDPPGLPERPIQLFPPPPPVDVIVENIEELPSFVGDPDVGAGCGEEAPPAPIVTGILAPE
jgi:hypothetical protein